MTKIIEDLKWRYATKKFDSNKKISETDFNTLKEVINLAPTSYGLQPFKVLIIENPELRKELVSASYNQEQISDASHVFVFCSYKKLEEGLIDSYIDNMASTRSIGKENLNGFKNMLHNIALKMSPESQEMWMSKQTYIALGQLMVACANLRIDAIPMEGFQASEYDRILNLSEQNLVATLVIPVGYRDESDNYQHSAKVRRKDLFKVI